jgi:hypothetical protein
VSVEAETGVGLLGQDEMYPEREYHNVKDGRGASECQTKVTVSVTPKMGH